MIMPIINTRENCIKKVVQVCNDLSPGRCHHVKQVRPDRQPATVRYSISIRKHQIRTGTLNARTLFQAGRLDNVKQEMDRLGINKLGISETRLKGPGIFKLERNTMIYSCGCKHEREVGIILDENTSRCLLG